MTRNQRNKSRRKPGLTGSSGTNVTREPAAYPDTTCSNTRRAPMAHSRCRANITTKPVRQTGGDLEQKLTTTRDNLIQLKIKANEDSLAYPQRADSKLAYLGLLVSDETDSAPTEAEYQEFDKLKKQTDDYLA